MAESDTRSLQQIRHETEQTRATLTTTVEELRGTVTDTAADIKNRLRPEAIKAEVSGYIKSRGEQLMHDMTEAARRNPMQAIAVGASVAYPALRLARAIPLPILMIGAGLFLAGSKTGRDLTQKASDFAEDMSDEARRRAQQFGERTSEMASDLGDSTADALERVKDTVAGTAEQLQQTGATAAQTARSRLDEGVRDMQSLVGEAGEAAISRTQEMKGMISGMAGSAGSAASETASRVGETIRDAQSRTAQAGREFFDSTRERLSEAGEKTAETLREQVRNNPIMVAGIGLLIGGLLASVLPKSETEASLMGPASDRMRRKARQAAAAGFDAAKGASGEILANVAQQASAEGLTPDGLAQSAQDVGQRLQRVAERAVTTAFDPDQQSEHKHQNESTESTGGGKQHG